MKEIWIISNRILLFQKCKNTNETQREALKLEFWSQSIRDIRRFSWQNLRWTYSHEHAAEVRYPHGTRGEGGWHKEKHCVSPVAGIRCLKREGVTCTFMWPTDWLSDSILMTRVFLLFLYMYEIRGYLF